MREYFCAYHSMLDATRKLSEAECGRLFRSLLAYSQGRTELINLQGREEIVFDIYSQQIDREIERYEQMCQRNRENVTSRNESSRVVTTRYDTRQGKGEDKGKGKSEEKGKDKGERGNTARARFTPPTVEEVSAYAREKGYAGFSAERFVAYYESNGWRVGRNPMKDWRATVRGWATRDGDQGRTQLDRRPQANPAQDYAQREYRDEDFGEDFFVDLDKYMEG